MNDKQEGSKEQTQADPTPPPLAPIPSANPAPIPPVDSQSAAHICGNELPHNPGPPPEDKLTKNDKVMIWLTIAIALGTIVSAGAIIMQWREMVGGGHQTDQIIAAAKINACAAKQFAQSADGINRGVEGAVDKLKQQTEDSEIFFRTDERSWVVVDKVEILKSYPADNNFPAAFKYGLYAKNVGKTVARNVRIHIDTFAANGGPPERGIKMTQMRRWRDRNGAVLGPFGPDKAGPQSLAPGEPTAVPVITSAQAPTNYFSDTLIGRIDYTDAFNVHHWRTFCYTVLDDKGSLAHCVTGNDEDQNPEMLAEKRK